MTETHPKADTTDDDVILMENIIAQLEARVSELEDEVEEWKNEAENYESQADDCAEESYVLGEALKRVERLTSDLVPSWFSFSPDPYKLEAYYNTLDEAHRIAKEVLDAWERGML